MRVCKRFSPGNAATTWLEDDGYTQNAGVSSFTIKYTSTAEKVTVGFERGSDNKYVPAWKELDIILPVGDERHVVSSDSGKPLAFIGADDRGRRVYRLSDI